jgi:anaerobic C4-dicarboxylate transporter DcuA
VGAFIANLLGKPLDQDEVYLERKAKGLIKLRGTSQVEIKPYASSPSASSSPPSWP